MIPLLATVVCAVIVAQTMWILKLQGDIAEMQRTWRPRNDAGPLPPMPWPPAGEDIEIEEYAEVA